MDPKDTWRLCHPVNINVYKNGVEGEAPTLVHIPAESKRNMVSVLEAIQSRVKLRAGYPAALYEMDGTLICQTYQLQMYQDYVVLSNVDRCFKSSCYGVRGPLVVVGPKSKHVHSIRRQNKYFAGVYGRGKDLDKKQKYGFASSFISDGIGPSDLPYVNNSCNACGALCQRARPSKKLNEPIEEPKTTRQCEVTPEELCPCSRQESNECIDVEDDNDESFYDRYLEECRNQMPTCPPCQQNEPIQQDIPCKPVTPVKRVNKSLNTEDMMPETESSEPFSITPVDSEHLIEFINRYRDIGGDIYRLFNDRMSQDPATGKFRKNSRRSSLTTDSRLGDDLYRVFVDRLKEKGDSSESRELSMPGSNTSYWQADSGLKICQEMPLLSLTNLQDMDEDGTGNRSASLDAEMVNEELQTVARDIDQDSIEFSDLTELREYSDEKTGTTTPHSRQRTTLTKVFTMQIQEQKQPFKLENGKLVISNKSESYDNMNNHGMERGDYPSPKLFGKNHPFGDKCQSSDDDDDKKAPDVKIIPRDFQTTHGDNMQQNRQGKTKTRNVCVQIGPSTTEHMDAPLSSTNQPNIRTINTSDYWQRLASVNNTARFGRYANVQNTLPHSHVFAPVNSSPNNMFQRYPSPITNRTPQPTMAPIFDSNGDVLYYMWSFPNANKSEF